MTTGEAATSPKVGIVFSTASGMWNPCPCTPRALLRSHTLTPSSSVFQFDFWLHTLSDHLEISFDDLTKPLDEESIKVTMDDFLNALHEVGPAFGASMDDLEWRRLNGIIDCGERHKHIHERALLLVEQIKDNQSPLVTYLLEATIGIESDFPYVKMISAESMIGLGEATKCAQIVKACSSDEDGLLGFDVHSDGHGQRQLTVLARDERMEITSSMNGDPLFPPKKKYFSCIEMNGFMPLIVIASQD
ncbi:hypothetical protein ZIOFF_069656 [Zingiber officinale]|uniref:Vesicle-fusing ATPase n=1 Tax=Zingiber officinale TaxID=94328 RepID=A0A8J5CBH4_ZINOF|nr:hypothetical protein ZIOFF_069656 [Zingiber officinale]